MSTPLLDRERYIRDNAVALVEDLEARVERQRDELRKLNSRVAHLTAERGRLLQALQYVWINATAASEIEAAARVALAASGITVGD